MKEKLLAKLVAKYPGLPKQFLGLFADKLSAKVTEESQIDTTIADLDNLPVSIQDLAAEYQKEGDRRVTEAQKKNPPAPKPDPAKPESGTDPNKPADEMPAWAKPLFDKLNKLETEKAQGTMKSKLTELLKDKKIPAKFYEKLPLPEKEEDLQSFADSIVADFTDFKQDLVNDGLSIVDKPKGGISGGQVATVDDDIKSWANKGKVAETVKK